MHWFSEKRAGRPFLFILFILTIAISCKRQRDLETFYPVPDFSLTDQTDRTVTFQELKGKIWVADFIFTSCGGTCPVITQQMRRLQNTLPSNTRLVSFT